MCLHQLVHKEILDRFKGHEDDTLPGHHPAQPWDEASEEDPRPFLLSDLHAAVDGVLVLGGVEACVGFMCVCVCVRERERERERERVGCPYSWWQQTMRVCCTHESISNTHTHIHTERERHTLHPRLNHIQGVITQRRETPSGHPPQEGRDGGEGGLPIVRHPCLVLIEPHEAQPLVGGLLEDGRAEALLCVCVCVCVCIREKA